MNLYKLTNELDVYYVVADNPQVAILTVKHKLEKSDYGFFGQRGITNTELIAEEPGSYPGAKCSFHDVLFIQEIINVKI